MYNVSNIDMWKFKMSAYFKSLGLHVYLATTKKSYIDNGRYLEANAQAMDALMHTLTKEYLSLIFHCAWNTLISSKEHTGMTPLR